jgi:hypothetical protein
MLLNCGHQTSPRTLEISRREHPTSNIEHPMRGAEGLGVGIGIFSSFHDRVALGGLNAGEENPDQRIGFAEHEWQRLIITQKSLCLRNSMVIGMGSAEYGAEVREENGVRRRFPLLGAYLYPESR